MSKEQDKIIFKVGDIVRLNGGQETVVGYAIVSPEMANNPAMRNITLVARANYENWVDDRDPSYLQALLEEGRICTECHADVVGNDPHAPDCITGQKQDDES